MSADNQDRLHLEAMEKAYSYCEIVGSDIDNLKAQLTIAFCTTQSVALRNDLTRAMAEVLLVKSEMRTIDERVGRVRNEAKP